MNLIYIYGPPGVGKFTVGAELHKLLGYPLIHNHLTVELARALWSFGSSEFVALNYRLRLLLIEEAGTFALPGMIMTHAYKQPQDDWYVRSLLQLASALSIRLCFVRLTCTINTLFERITAEDRTAFSKIHDVDTLTQKLDRYNYFSSMPDCETLVIDNSVLSPPDVAKSIIGYFQFPIA